MSVRTDKVKNTRIPLFPNVNFSSFCSVIVIVDDGLLEPGGRSAFSQP